MVVIHNHVCIFSSLDLFQIRKLSFSIPESKLFIPSWTMKISCEAYLYSCQEQILPYLPNSLLFNVLKQRSLYSILSGKWSLTSRIQESLFTHCKRDNNLLLYHLGELPHKNYLDDFKCSKVKNDINSNLAFYLLYILNNYRFTCNCKP